MKINLLALLVLLPVLVQAQVPATNADTTESWYRLHFQQTTVTQWHPAFTAKYSGTNSLQPKDEAATSLTATFFADFNVTKWLRIYVNPELAGGAGVSRALGVAGFMNGETFRVGDPKPQFYLARGYAQIVRPWGNNGTWHAEVGKFSLADYFDQNAASHDPRSRFLNWALMSNGAWDYPANTRGYTVSALVGFTKGPWALQVAVSQVPTVANGPKLDRNIGANRGHTAEATYTWARGTAREANVRLLGFYNLAGMGSYTLATDPATWQDGGPEITLSRQAGRSKYGIGLSADKQLKGDYTLFGRVGYNDGKNETWAFTEIDRTASLGVVRTGQRWKRPLDVVGVAVVANGLSRYHKSYLAAGGTGFMLGDGALRYAPEAIIEVFYLLQLHEEHFFITPDYQLVMNPGYNADRGPVHVFAVRVHTEF